VAGSAGGLTSQADGPGMYLPWTSRIPGQVPLPPLCEICTACSGKHAGYANAPWSLMLADAVATTGLPVGMGYAWAGRG
jgi:hypothetical protein